MKKIFFVFMFCFIFIYFGCQKKQEIKIRKVEKVPEKIEKKDLNQEEKMLFIDFESEELKKNTIGFDGKKEIAVYLPESYKNSEKEYPVVYFLCGYCETVEGDAEWLNLKERVDLLIKDKKIEEMIIVMVDGVYLMGGSFYINSSSIGNWENYVSNELVNYVDKNYRTIKRSEMRFLTGFSMGGYGAINIGMRHPDIFKNIYSISPGLQDANGIKDSFLIEERIESQIKVLEMLNSLPEKRRMRKLRKLPENLELEFAYGMAFSGKDEYPYFEYPYSLENGEIKENKEIFEKWKNGYGGFDKKVVNYKDNLNQLKSFVIEYGTNDNYPWIPRGCEYFSNKLKEQGIEHELFVHNGNHGGNLPERLSTVILPYISEKIKSE